MAESQRNQDPNAWRKPEFRNNMVRHLEGILTRDGAHIPTPKISEFEGKIFSESQNLNEYKQKLVKLAQHLKTITSQRMQQSSQMANNMPGHPQPPRPAMQPGQPQYNPQYQVQHPSTMMANTPGPSESPMMVLNPMNQPQTSRMVPQMAQQAAPPYQMQRAAYSPANTNIATPSPGMRMSQTSPGVALTPGAPPSVNQPPDSSPAPSSGMPGSVGSTNPPDVEQMYQDKLKELSIYIEPVKKMIQRNKDSPDQHYNKMVMLLNVLQPPNNQTQHVAYDALLKCEDFLKKNFARIMTQQTGSSTQTSHWCQPLLTAVAESAKSVLCKNVLQQTFTPAVHTLYGPKITISDSTQRRKRSAANSEDKGVEYKKMKQTPVPHLIQRELARLPSTFKVMKDKTAQLVNSGDQAHHITAEIVDQNLPKVPVLKVSLPADYPTSNPVVEPTCLDVYSGSDFLSKVRMRFETNLSRLQYKPCLTDVLDTWMTSVRHVSTTTRKLASHGR